MIVGASDRMLTSGDIIEYEPPQTKLAILTPHCIALCAGDAAIQASILTGVFNTLRAQPKTEISDIARIYAREFVEIRRQSADADLLAPIGLNIQDFTKKKSDLDPELIKDLACEVRDHGLEVETIIAGLDSTGAHLYIVTDPGKLQCLDTVGFACIGVGQAHADPQFMFAKYTGTWPFSNALYLTYMAKKRSEVAPGVGEATDMFYIAKAPPGTVQIYENILNNNIEPVYQDMETAIKAATDNGMLRIDRWLYEFVAAANARATQSGQPAQPGQPSPSSPSATPPTAQTEAPRKRRRAAKNNP